MSRVLSKIIWVGTASSANSYSVCYTIGQHRAPDGATVGRVEYTRDIDAVSKDDLLKDIRTAYNKVRSMI